MSGVFAVQPDGKFARFSTVVDDFTHFDLTKEEVVGLIVADAVAQAKRDADLIVFRALARPQKYAEYVEKVRRVCGDAHVSQYPKGVNDESLRPFS